MSDKVYEVPAEWIKRAFIKEADYKKMYEHSLADPDGFWAEHGKRIHWYRPFTKVKHTSFDRHNVSIKWFEDGTTNAASNCIDRHLAHRGDQTAIIWEGDDPKDSKHITYRELHDQVCRLANCCQPHRQEGRPRHHLPADDPGSGLRDARLRPHRRDPFGGVRRLLAGLPRRPHRGLQIERRHHRRRRAARRPQGAAQGQFRRGARNVGGVDHVIVVKRTGAPSTWSPAATSGTTKPPTW